MNTTYLILGSNIECRSSYLKKAISYIKSEIGQITKKSAVYESAPWGFEDNINFLNQIIIVSTQLTATELLKKIQEIEYTLGRKRIPGKYTSRTIDIDILFFNKEHICCDSLTIPHQRLHERKFTLLPLNELTPDFIHPVLNKSVKKLLSDCSDNSAVKKITDTST